MTSKRANRMHRKVALCPHHATCAHVKCESLVMSIPAMPHCVPLCVEVHCVFRMCLIPCRSEFINQARWHQQCQQSPHTFQQNKIACCDLWILPLSHSFNRLDSLSHAVSLKPFKTAIDYVQHRSQRWSPNGWRQHSAWHTPMVLDPWYLLPWSKS